MVCAGVAECGVLVCSSSGRTVNRHGGWSLLTSRIAPCWLQRHAAPTHARTGAIVTVPESVENIRTVLRLAAKNPLIAPCAGLHPVQPCHHPQHPRASDTPSPHSARCVCLDDLPAALDLIRANADALVAIGEVIGSDWFCLTAPRQTRNRHATNSQTHKQHTRTQNTHTRHAQIGLDFSPHVLGGDDALKDVQRRAFAAQVRLASELGLPLNVRSRAAGRHAIDLLLVGLGCCVSPAPAACVVRVGGHMLALLIS